MHRLEAIRFWIDGTIEAVKQWKYAPGDSNTFEVKVDFVPRHTNN